MCDQQGSDQHAHTRSLIRAFAHRLNFLWVLCYRPNIFFEVLSLKGGYTGCSESTLVKMPHCWKSHVTAQFVVSIDISGRVAASRKAILFLLCVGYESHHGFHLFFVIFNVRYFNMYPLIMFGLQFLHLYKVSFKSMTYLI